MYVDLKTTLGVAYLLDFSRLLLNTQGHQVNIARKRRSNRIRVEAVEVITTKPRKHSNCERFVCGDLYFSLTVYCREGSSQNEHICEHICSNFKCHTTKTKNNGQKINVFRRHRPASESLTLFGHWYSSIPINILFV